MRELLSALADGEASDGELRQILQSCADPEEADPEAARETEKYRATWANYQRARAALRGEPHSGADLSEQVAAAIAQDRPPNRLAVRIGHLFRLPATALTQTLSQKLGQALRQTAIAASVAAVALFGIGHYQGMQPGHTPTLAATAPAPVSNDTAPLAQAPAGFAFQPATRTVSSPAPLRVTDRATAQIPVDRAAVRFHIDELVRAHSDHSVQAAQEVLPAARVPVPAAPD